MSKKLYEESNIQAIANAIRSKNGENETYNTSEMASAILEISTSTEPDLEILSADANGTYYPSDGKDGFSQVVVNIPNMGKRFCVTETVVSILQRNIDMIAVEVV